MPPTSADDQLIEYLLAGGNGVEPLNQKQVLAVLRFLAKTVQELRGITHTLTEEVTRLTLAVNAIQDREEVTGAQILSEARRKKRQWERRGWDVVKLLLAVAFGFLARHLAMK